jgi:hypothetical protein
MKVTARHLLEGIYSDYNNSENRDIENFFRVIFKNHGYDIKKIEMVGRDYNYSKERKIYSLNIDFTNNIKITIRITGVDTDIILLSPINDANYNNIKEFVNILPNIMIRIEKSTEINKMVTY